MPPPAGVTITPLNPAAPPARILIAPPAHPSHDLEDAVTRAWEVLRADNPRLYDAPILAVAHIDPGTNLIVCRRDAYRRLAVQTAEPSAPSVDTGVYQLSVTGAITALDRSGNPHILIGRRGGETRMYGGLWELAPAGGIDAPHPPPKGRDRLGAGDIFAALAKEAQEELALDLGSTPHPARLVCRDHHARSDDLIIPVRLPAPVDPRKPPACATRAWEYLDTAWLPLADAPDFVSRHAGACIPPMRALLADPAWLA